MKRFLVLLAAVATVVVASPPAAANAPFERDEGRGPLLTVGADGALWSAGTGDSLLREAAGSRTSIPLPAGTTAADLSPGIAGDPVWIATGAAVLRVRPDGSTEALDVPGDARAIAIEPTSDGRMGILTTGPRYGTVSSAGAFELRTAPFDVVNASLGRGPDGALWVTSPSTDTVARIGADGTVETFSVPGHPMGAPLAGPDGRVWVQVPGAVVRLDTSGTEVGRTALPVPQSSSSGDDHDMAVADGAVWIGGGGGVNRVTVDGRATAVRAGLDPSTYPYIRSLAAIDGTLQFGNGHLRVAGVTFPEVTLTASPATGVHAGDPVELVAEVRGSGPAPTGTVTFVGYLCCYHGSWATEVIGTAPVGPDGRARMTTTLAFGGSRGLSSWYARYEGDARYGANSSPLVSVGFVNPTSPWEGYVRLAYQALFGRPASTDETAYWSDRLDTGMSRAAFATALSTSAEGVRAQLAARYEAALGRPLDDSGLTYWRSLVLRGMSFTDVGAHLFASGEFYASNGATPDGFVGALYRELLGREADAAGRAFWVSRLAGGASWFEVALAFYRSPESRSDRVNALYLQLLERAPDAAGWQYWTERLRTEDDLRLAAHLVASDEFVARSR